MFNKVWKGLQAAGSFFEGRKRRIAAIAGIITTVVPSHTVLYKVAFAAAWLFSGADLVQKTANKFKSKPEEK